MKRQLLKMAHKGQYIVVYDDSKKVNRYILYHKHYVPGEGWKQRKLNAYGDMASCIHEIIQRISGRTWIADQHILYHESGAVTIY